MQHILNRDQSRAVGGCDFLRYSACAPQSKLNRRGPLASFAPFPGPFYSDTSKNFYFRLLACSVRSLLVVFCLFLSERTGVWESEAGRDLGCRTRSRGEGPVLEQQWAFLVLVPLTFPARYPGSALWTGLDYLETDRFRRQPALRRSKLSKHRLVKRVGWVKVSVDIGQTVHRRGHFPAARSGPCDQCVDTGRDPDDHQDQHKVESMTDPVNSSTVCTSAKLSSRDNPAGSMVGGEGRARFGGWNSDGA